MSKALADQLNSEAKKAHETTDKMMKMEAMLVKQSALLERLAKVKANEDSPKRPPLREELTNIWAMVYQEAISQYIKLTISVSAFDSELVMNEEMKKAVIKADMAVTAYLQVRKTLENPIDKAIDQHTQLLALSRMADDPSQPTAT